MKKLFVLLLLCLSNLIFAQSYTQKYNDLYNRYDYFNDSGKLVGYKYYDDLNRAWKYKDLTEQPKSTYINPINSDLVNRALSSKQNAYDNNVQRVQNVIDEIKSDILKMSADNDTKRKIHSKFVNQTLKAINSKNLDYSSNSITSQVIKFLYSDYQRIVREEQD